MSLDLFIAKANTFRLTSPGQPDPHPLRNSPACWPVTASTIK